MGGTQESLLAQPHNVREKLPEEGSGLGNIAPATLLVLSEQTVNGPTPAKGEVLRLRVGGRYVLALLSSPLSSQSH